MHSSRLKSRAIAAKIISTVLKDKRSLRDSLGNQNHDPFVQELCYGVLRFYFQLDFFLSKLTKRPIKDSEINALLLIGLYQLFFLKKAEYAVVSETVNAARDLKKAWATAFINGVLRNALRVFTQDKNLLIKHGTSDSVNFSHPDWLIKKIKKAYPENWQEILVQNNQHPPMTLRLNTQKLSRKDYVEALKSVQIETHFSPYGIQLKTPLPIEKVYGFLEGFVSVQDEAAQLAATLLELSSEQNVLDACAAPGGKTTHMLEIEPNLKQLVAVDHDQKRLEKVKANLDRLHLKAELLCEDVKKLHHHFDIASFDRILLDVPCSATGVIRRNPDIKLLRTEADILNLAQEQYQILKSTWPFLKPNGILLYVTCSILPEENTQVLEKFLQETSDAKEFIIEADFGRPMKIGRQILPGESNMDGFYFARLVKKRF